MVCTIIMPDSLVYVAMTFGDNGHGKPYKDISKNNKGRRVTSR